MYPDWLKKNQDLIEIECVCLFRSVLFGLSENKLLHDAALCSPKFVFNTVSKHLKFARSYYHLYHWNSKTMSWPYFILQKRAIPQQSVPLHCSNVSRTTHARQVCIVKFNILLKYHYGAKMSNWLIYCVTRNLKWSQHLEKNYSCIGYGFEIWCIVRVLKWVFTVFAMRRTLRRKS